ncbi:hypothetical protein [Curtobacterium flaccumfaciens]|uniref:hypothetical protein n=1 Tax=Curtobacterium flaccumfaciens TaxID=2035 RepID=UPI0011263322|nr:hypothetical protein [Curtobacterium flaccumfaciens]TPG05144.1 hypothetical protein EAH85_14340 [Curtobacterium flaccumfaciens]
MPYETIGGNFERASRLGHSEAALRALADQRVFHVPTDQNIDQELIRERVVTRPLLVGAPLRSALAIDGSHLTQPIRDGFPSVIYGFAQIAAAYVDLQAMTEQAAERFTDPAAIDAAVNSALITFDLPTAGAYAREGISIQQSWRELIADRFSTKRVEVDGLNRTLLELLFQLRGTSPGNPALTLPVNCPNVDCDEHDVEVPAAGRSCPTCGLFLFPTDTMRLHESVTEDGQNTTALGRLRSVIELLALVGLTTLLWERSRADALPSTLFILDGPLAVYGEPAKLRGWAQDYFQAMRRSTPDGGPYLCGLEKTGVMVDFATQVANAGLLHPGELLVCDQALLERITNNPNAAGYGKETYFGRKFVYRCTDGRIIVLTVLADAGAAYDSAGGQPDPGSYSTLAAVLDVVERTGSSMYRNGVIPVAAAHGHAAFPIGVGTDVLKLVAERRLGFDR